MSKKLYVAGIPYATTEEALRNAFAEHASVGTVSIIVDTRSGRSRGFGFVEILDDEKADDVIKEMNGLLFEGRTLTVSHARPIVVRPQTS